MKTQSRCLGAALLAAIVLILPAAPAPAQTGPGYALSFNGTNQSVSASVPPLASNYTFSAWVYLRSGGDVTTTRVGVLSAPNCGGSVELMVRSQTGSTSDPQYLELGRCGVFNGTASSTVVPLSQWVHLAVTVSPTKQVSYFINGLAAGDWDASSVNLALGTNITLADNSVRQFNGVLDEVQIWSVARSQADIQAGMNRAPNLADTNLVAYWPFSEGTGTASTADASGHNHTGTLVNAPAWVSSTVPFAPDVATGGATGVGRTNATLNAAVNPGNLATTAWFQWGPDTNYGNLSATANLPATNSSLAVSAALTDLSPGQTCHFRLVATNSAGTANGADLVFTTQTGTNTVTTLADSGAGSLRQTIANSLAGDVIIFATNGTITLTNGELVLTNSLTISGPGATNLALSGNLSNRVFNISSSNATVVLSGLTICDGKAPDGLNGTNGTQNDAGSPGSSGSNGGGIFSLGNLMLSRCVVTANKAGKGGAGGASGYRGGAGNGSGGGAGGAGGGIYSAGPLTLTACTFCVNAAGPGGAGGNGNVGMYTVGCGGAGGDGGNGGGICGAGTLALTACTFSTNAAGPGGAGGMGGATTGIGGPGGTSGVGGTGGGIYSVSTLTLVACTFSANAAGAGGPGGPGAWGDGAGGIGGTGGAGATGGPGGTGGGIQSSGTLAITACTFSANAAGAGGPGGASGGSDGGPAGYGGNAGNGGPGGTGGGIFSSASATSSALHNSLFALNLTGTGGAGGAGSPSGLPGIAGSGSDLSGAFTSQGHNLLGWTEGSPGLINGINGDLVGTAAAPINPLLAPLTNNGGPTLTLALLPGSPAIDAGDDTFTGTDQRGLPRLSGAHVDIGAFELDVSAFSAPTAAPATGAVSNNATTGLSSASLSTTVNPNGLNSMVYLEYGITANYGAATTPVSVGSGTGPLAANLALTGLAPGLTYHYRVVVTSPAGTTYGPDQTLTTTPSGDLNGDGVVSAAEFATVRQNYWQFNPLQITGLSGLDRGTLQFGLANGASPSFTVLASTNLVDWQVLSNAAVPQYLFNDPDATKYPRRFYRLRWP